VTNSEPNIEEMSCQEKGQIFLQFRQWRAVFKGDRDRRREVFLFVYSGEKVRVSWREFLLGERG
jgi:hypothetical protein